MSAPNDPSRLAPRALARARTAAVRGAMDEAVDAIDEALAVLRAASDGEEVVVADDLADAAGHAAALAVRAGDLARAAAIVARVPSELAPLAAAARALADRNALAAFVSLGPSPWTTEGARAAVRALAERVAAALDGEDALERAVAIHAAGLGEDSTEEGSRAAESRRKAWALARGWRPVGLPYGALIRRLLARRADDPAHESVYEAFAARWGWLADDDPAVLDEAGPLAERELASARPLPLRTFFRWALASGGEERARARLDEIVAALPSASHTARRAFDAALRARARREDGV